MRCALDAWIYRAAGLALLLVVHSAAARSVPLVAIDGGAGLPGGTAAATISLDKDIDDVAVSADVSIQFADPPLSTDPSACAIAPRLAATHRLTASTPLAGQLLLAIEPLAELAPLGDGPLADCGFGIALGTPAGTTALSFSDVELRGADGEPIQADSTNGFVTILPSGPTPTDTATPTVTATFTATPIPPPSDTPTATPTPTLFKPVKVADTVGSCAVVSPANAADAWLLFAGAATALLRRRR